MWSNGHFTKGHLAGFLLPPQALPIHIFMICSYFICAPFSPTNNIPNFGPDKLKFIRELEARHLKKYENFTNLKFDAIFIGVDIAGDLMTESRHEESQ